MKIISRIIFSILTIYLIICALIFTFQRHLQYLPSGYMQEPASYGLKDFSEETLITKDDVEIKAWFKAPRNNKKIIVYFHGNAGNLGERADKLRTFAENSDFGILAISYRGYFGSAGKPSEKGLLLDAKAATDFLLAKGYKNIDVILYGESLGSGVAIQRAAEFKPYAIILEAPYYSITKIAERIYWYLPVKILLKDHFDSYKYVAAINAPVLIFHGTKDLTVPYKEGEKLYDLFTSPKKLVTIEGAGHLGFSDEFLFEEIKKFLAELPI